MIGLAAADRCGGGKSNDMAADIVGFVFAPDTVGANVVISDPSRKKKDNV
jgi:hypothetical protein